MEETKGVKVPAKNTNEVLWWKQYYITKEQMADFFSGISEYLFILFILITFMYKIFLI